MKMILNYLALFLVTINLSTLSYCQSNDIGSGIAINFPGAVGSRINLGNVYNDLNFPLSVEAWVCPTAWTVGGYSPIISTDNVGVGGSYYGFWFRFNSSGNLIFEIGDGSGAGGSDRRGKRTTSTVTLNKWTHVAVVANSVTDIKFYFNGVLQPVVSTDGGALNTSILHSSYPAYLGAQITPSAEHDYTGLIDEIRLWNIARSQTDLQDKMCEKLTGLEAGLIGNWRFDENYLGTTVEDYSVSNIDGTTIGSATKSTSGAPIGDISVYTYTGDYTGISLSLNSAGGDKFKVNKIGNLPYGIHLYRVNTQPYFIEGLSDIPGYYYGVFSADNAAEVKYTFTYTYSYANGVVNEGNETEAHVYRRLDNSITSWSPQPASLDTLMNRLSKKNFTGRSEFVFNIDSANSNGGTRFENALHTSGAPELVVNPNPALNNVLVANLEPGIVFYITNIDGAIVFSGTADNASWQMDVSMLSSGLYFIVQRNSNIWRYGQFQKL